MSIIKKNLVVKTFKFIIASLFVFFLWSLISLYSFTPILNFFISKEEGYIPDLKGKTKSEAIEILDKADNVSGAVSDFFSDLFSKDKDD